MSLLFVMVKYKPITNKLCKAIEDKIAYEGFDYYFNEGGWGKTDMRGTVLEDAMQKYVDARADLRTAMIGFGIDPDGSQE
jgi:hypothetical protein